MLTEEQAIPPTLTCLRKRQAKLKGYTVMSFTNILARMRRWYDVRETIRELNQLDDRELNDFGIGRWRISEIAKHSVG
jgi:uncharacterized protein YjiS (DUF1127 family)